MREALILLKRGPVPLLVLALAIGGGWVSASPVTSLSVAVGAAADGVAPLMLPATLLLAIWMMCPDSDSQITADRRAVGLDDLRWVAARAGTVVCAAYAVLVGNLVGSVGAALTKTSGVELLSAQPVARSMFMAVLSVTLYALWGMAAIRGRRTAASLLISTAALVISVGVAFAPRGGVGAFAKSIWPVSALRTITMGTEGTAQSLGAAAVGSILAATLASIWRLTVPQPPQPVTRAGVSREVAGRGFGLRVGVAAGVATCLACGAVLPTLLTRSIPWEIRPSTVLQQISGTDPASSSRRFLEALWSQNTGVANRLTAQGSAAAVVAPYLQLVGVRPQSLAVHTVSIGSNGSASVQAEGFARSVSLCLTRRGGGWVVRSMVSGGACP